MISRVLYISYDGILEPLGQSQVLRYLERLARSHKIILVSFEKPHDWREVEARESLRSNIKAANIIWIPLKYHKWPSAFATLFDIFQGIFVGSWVVMRYRIGIVHARSYVPSVVAVVLKKLFGLKYIFDMRGFWADERVDGKLWPMGGRLYRTAKWFERVFLLNADRVVSLTQASIREMHGFPYLLGKMPKFEYITTCTDLQLFRQSNVPRSGSGPDSSFVLGYVGSVGVWYMFDETLRCFQLLRQRIPNAKMLILNRGGHDYIFDRLNALGIDQNSVTLKAVDHVGVAKAIQQMDAAVFFYKPTYSKVATAPTKLGEFLGSGIPCLSNSGVGDMAMILESGQVGVVVRSFDERTMLEAVEQLLQLSGSPDIGAKCRSVAEQYFSLEDGVASYDRIYQELSVRGA